MEMGNPLPFQPEHLPGLAARRNLERGFAVQGRYFYLGAQGGLNKVDGQFVEDIIIRAAEEFVLLN